MYNKSQFIDKVFLLSLVAALFTVEEIPRKTSLTLASLFGWQRSFGSVIKRGGGRIALRSLRQVGLTALGSSFFLPTSSACRTVSGSVLFSVSGSKAVNAAAIKDMLPNKTIGRLDQKRS